MINKNVIVATLAISITLGSTVIFAIPDTNIENPLPSLGIAIPDGVGEIIRDHELSNILHVGPSYKKEIEGSYTELVNAEESCPTYLQTQNQAYLSPDTEQGRADAYDSNRYISNYFQLTYSIQRSNISSLNDVTAKRLELQNLIEENAEKEVLASFIVSPTQYQTGQFKFRTADLFFAGNAG